MRRTKRLISVQIARAIGAAMVAAWHLEWIANDLKLLAEMQLPDWLRFGYAGVDLFFVLSGYVMADIALADTPPRAGEFIAHRVFRVYPPYWLVTLCETLLLAVSGLLRPRSAAEYIADYTLLPQKQLPLLGVGWTLEHEVIFYAMVAVLCFFSLSAHLLLMLAAASAMSLVHAICFAQAWDFHLLSLYNLLFFSGALVRSLASRLQMSPWLAGCGLMAFPLASVVVLDVYAGSVPPTDPQGLLGIWRVSMFGLASVFLVAGLIGAESKGWLSGPMCRFLCRLGDVSYGIYLLHMPIYQIAGAWLLRNHKLFDASPVATTIAIVCVLGCTYAAAEVFHRYVEVPCMRLGRLITARQEGVLQSGPAGRA